MRRPMTIVIVGCGIAGPALAHRLVRRGHRPVLVERHRELRAGGHAVDIRGTAMTVVERMGLSDRVREARTQIQTLSAVGRRRRYDVALAPMQRRHGDGDIEIMRDDLVRILYESIADDVEVLFGNSPVAIEDCADGLGVTFERNRSRTADLVVGADGQHSVVRGIVFGAEERFARHLGAYLSIYTVDNILGLRDQAVLYNEPGRGAAMFTVRGNETAKVVLLFRSPELSGISGEDAQRDLLRRQFSGMGWETDRLIASMDDAHDFYFDQMSQIRMPRWSRNGTVLLGDAGYGPSPMSGQGTSLALLGAYGLAHHLDSGDGLAAWEHGFRPTVEQNQALARHGLAMLVPNTRLAVAVRNQALRAMPVLTRVGGGFGGRVERAARGYALPGG